MHRHDHLPVLLGAALVCTMWIVYLWKFTPSPPGSRPAAQEEVVCTTVSDEVAKEVSGVECKVPTVKPVLKIITEESFEQKGTSPPSDEECLQDTPMSRKSSKSLLSVSSRSRQNSNATPSAAPAYGSKVTPYVPSAMRRSSSAKEVEQVVHDIRTHDTARSALLKEVAMRNVPLIGRTEFERLGCLLPFEDCVAESLHVRGSNDRARKSKVLYVCAVPEQEVEVSGRRPSRASGIPTPSKRSANATSTANDEWVYQAAMKFLDLRPDIHYVWVEKCCVPRKATSTPDNELVLSGSPLAILRADVVLLVPPPSSPEGRGEVASNLTPLLKSPWPRIAMCCGGVQRGGETHLHLRSGARAGGNSSDTSSSYGAIPQFSLGRPSEVVEAMKAAITSAASSMLETGLQEGWRAASHILSTPLLRDDVPESKRLDVMYALMPNEMEIIIAGGEGAGARKKLSY